MGWGDVIGQLLVAGSQALLIKRWLDITDPTKLQLAIRSDMRHFNKDAAEAMLRALNENLKVASRMSDRRMRDQIDLAIDVFIGEARRLQIM